MNIKPNYLQRGIHVININIYNLFYDIYCGVKSICVILYITWESPALFIHMYKNYEC